MRRTARILGLFLVLLAAVAATAAVNVLRVSSRQVPADPAPEVAVDVERVSGILAEAIRIPTVSSRDPARFPRESFRELIGLLVESFPRVHTSLVMEPVADLSLLYTWEGTDPSLEPFLLLGHLDVVPVEAGTEEEWTHPPFAGRIAGGFVWGRGAMDVKMSVVGVLSAVERLLADGFVPRRTAHLVFGHDEEVSGSGAAAVAGLLASRNTRLHFVLDEGMAITEGIVPGISEPVALVGIAEKGFASLELTVETEGGHSAMPPPHTAAGRLARAVAHLEANPFPADLRGPAREMFLTLAPEMRLPLRILFTNLWLFEPLLERRLAGAVSTNAAIRTTTAVTILESGVQDNVIPGRARAVANFRILPGRTVEEVRHRVGALLEEEGVEVRVLPGAREPSPVSSTASPGFRTVATTVREVFPGSLVAPALVLGGTDSRHFSGLTRDVYRFVPLRVGPEDLGRIHGSDERIAVANLVEIVRFYIRLVGNAAA